MTARMVGVCEACQKNKHNACQNEGACVCALRQHPEIQPLNITTPRYVMHNE